MITLLPRPATGRPPRTSPAEGGVSPASSAPDVALVNGIARVLDTTGLDPLVGLLVPGVGDLLSSLAGLVVVGLAVRRRMPAAVIARMLMNLALDAGIGSIPLVGDAFDIFHKAHRKNAELYTAQTARPARSSWKDAFVVVAATLAFLAALALPVYVAVRVIGALT
jgi:hypothetical protein